MILMVFNQVLGMFILLYSAFCGLNFISHNPPLGVTLKQVASDETIAILFIMIMITHLKIICNILMCLQHQKKADRL